MQRGRELQKVGPLLFSEGECKQILAETASLSSFQLVLIGLAWKNSECCTCANENANVSPRWGTRSACAPALIAAAGAWRHVCDGKSRDLDLTEPRKQRALEDEAWIRQTRAKCRAPPGTPAKPRAVLEWSPVPFHLAPDYWTVCSCAGEVATSPSGSVYWFSCLVVISRRRFPVRKKAVLSNAEMPSLSTSLQPGASGTTVGYWGLSPCRRTDVTDWSRALTRAGMSREGWEIPAMFLDMEPHGKAVVEAVADGSFLAVWAAPCQYCCSLGPRISKAVPPHVGARFDKWVYAWLSAGVKITGMTVFML